MFSNNRDPDKLRISISVMPISSPNPIIDQLLELSRWDTSNKYLNIENGEEISIFKRRVSGWDADNSASHPTQKCWTLLNIFFQHLSEFVKFEKKKAEQDDIVRTNTWQVKG